MYFDNEESLENKKSNIKDFHLRVSKLIQENEEQKEEEIPITERIALYPVKTALQSPSSESFTPEVTAKLFPEELADTPEGRFKLTERLAAMKQAAPVGTEIGIRINPKSGNAEFYARGHDLDYTTYHKNMKRLLNEECVITEKESYISKEDYANAKTHFSPHEQQTLINNTNASLKAIENLGSEHNSLDAIQEYIHEQTGFSSQLSSNGKQEVEVIKDTLAQAGLTNIPLNQTVVTASSNEKETALKL